MQPIRELLSRIRWDADFGNAEFRIGFYDRMEHSILYVSFREIALVPGDHFSFHYIDEEGVSHSVPMHRIKEVYRNGERIWHREQ